jgi:hypothetical protein
MLAPEAKDSDSTHKDGQDTEAQKKRALDRKRLFDSECIEFTRSVLVIILTGGMLLGIALASISCKECLFFFIVLSACLCQTIPIMVVPFACSLLFFAALNWKTMSNVANVITDIRKFGEE